MFNRFEITAFGKSRRCIQEFTEMKAQPRCQGWEDPALENEFVRLEIQTFLEALKSYPQGFAANPRLTFEEHRNSLLAFASRVSSFHQTA